MSEETRRIYINKLSGEDAYIILTTPKLRELLKDYIDDLKRELYNSYNDSLKTKYAALYEPDKLGLDKVRLLEKDGFVGIKIGKFIVQVSKPGEFIVYRNDTRLGFLFKAPDIPSAIYEAIQKYDKLLKLFELNKAKDNRMGRFVPGTTIAVERPVESKEFAVAEILTNSGAVYMGPHNIHLLHRKLEEKEVMVQ